MKRNGKNIITSDDITVLGKNSGKSLEEVLENLQSESDSLKSNVKWLYKYGGVGGSGSGGGGGTPTFSDKWSAVVQLTTSERIMNVPLTDIGATSYEDAMFESADNVKIIIYNPYGQEFRATISYGNRVLTRILFNKSEGYSANYPVNIQDNGNLRVEIADTAAVTDPKLYGLHCIVNAYNFEEHILYDTGREIVKNSRNTYLSYMSDLADQGNLKYQLIASTFYKFPLKIEWTTIDGNTHSQTFNEDSSGQYNNEDLFNGGIPMIDTLDNFIPGGEALYEKAGTYTFNVKKYIVNDSIDTLISDTNFLVDLVPRELYLSIQPKSSFVTYQDTNVAEPEATYIGSKEFAITPYMGQTADGSLISVRIKVDNVYYEGGKIFSIEVRTTAYPTIHFTLPEGVSEDWIQIDFEVCPDDLFGSNTRVFTRYLRIKAYDQTISWFPNNVQESIGAHYRFGETSDANRNFKYRSNNQIINGNSRIIRSVNDDEPIEVISNSLFTLPPDAVSECMINIGLQYNDINDDTARILKITDDQGNSDISINGARDIVIYQNSITYGSSAIGYVSDQSSSGDGGTISGFFINKELDYKTTENKNYQLLTITRRYVKTVNTDNGEEDKYEIAVYINGVLQTCMSAFITAIRAYSRFILNNCNYSINLLDIQHFIKGQITDATVVRYWYAYSSNIQENTEDLDIKIRLLDVFNDCFTNVMENNYVKGRVKVTSEGFNSLCELRTVPIMCVTYDSTSYNGVSFMDWSDRRRDANSEENDPVNVKVWWKGKTESKVRSVNMDDDVRTTIGTPDGGDINGQFTLKIQGSTTRTYKSKNYTLTLNGESEDGQYIPIFTPYFEYVNQQEDTEEVQKYKYKHSFLPEKEFTLKADVVDSSHTNNTCMGSFINDVTTKFNLATSSGGRYVNYVKNCLQGFPFLMFVYESTTREYYYLGIYNFNLGRGSYFNLGYVDTSLLDNFTFENNLRQLYYVRREDYESVKSGFISAEVQDNKPEFDFSQYDQSILFKHDIIDTRYMFSDIVPQHIDDDYTKEKQSISNFVKNISRAGGYIFQELDKGFLDENTNVASSANPGYARARYVPQATQQWEKYKKNDGNLYYRKKSGTEPAFTLNDLTKCIEAHEGLSGDEEEAFCDYKSLVEYYTICMAFGLLDNVQKNLTIKTWNNNKDNGIATYYFAFYDMDTCLGINNLAGDVKYFAFSDYWGNAENNTGTTISVIGESQEQTLYELDSIDILRDYTPGAALDYFDIPSHYAFAIAKYAKSILGDNASTLLSPQDLWAYWRTNQDLQNVTETVVGCLTDAQKFLDTYYNKYMEGIDELMFNYNYRAKYFKEKTDIGNTYDEELSRFHGNRRNYVKDWLTKRFHILDAYFNLPKSIIPINDGKGIYEDGHNANYYEPRYENTLIDFSGNPDVQITKDIFTSAGTSFGSPDPEDPSTWLIVKAPDYTPLMVREGESITGRFLLNDDSKYYRINYVGGGASQRLNFLGSTLWTYIHNINFLNGTCAINSRYLENLVGQKGNISNWTLTLPSLRAVQLISTGYSGDLIFNQNEMSQNYTLYPNLKSIDISNSSISLTVNDGNVKTINLNNIRSTNISITNCPSLQSVECNGMTITDRCTMQVSWTRNFTLSGCKIKTLVLTGKIEDGHALGKLTVQNDRLLSSLTVSSYKDIVVSNCPFLTNFVSNSNVVKTISITSCGALKSATVNVTNCNSLVLEGCNLETLILSADTVNDFNNLKIFKVSGATFENIQCQLTNNATIQNPTSTSKLLNLKLLGGLTDFYIRQDENIEYIQFANIAGTPVVTRQEEPFYKLINLKRIYGNIQFYNASQLFRNLTQFSLHGPNNQGSIRIGSNTYPKVKSKTIGNSNYNIVQTPFQLISGEDPNSPFTHDQIVTAYENILSQGLNAIWQSGDGVTNISFTKDIRSNFDYVANNTSFSEFDIYYFFNAFALSKVNNNVSIGYQSFWSNNAGIAFSYAQGNQFNRYMFYGCEHITSFGTYVFNIPATLIYPPTTDGENVVQDDGLFSPLYNLSSISLFTNGGFYSNRFLFRRKTGTLHPNYSNLTSISHQSFALLYDDINSCEISSQLPSNLNTRNDSAIGSMKGFFNNLPIISGLQSALGSSGQMNYSDLIIPTTMTSIVNSFNSSYGKGEFDWDKTFDKNSMYSRLVEIVNSFKIGNRADSNGVRFVIHDMMFANMPALRSIGNDCPYPGKQYRHADNAPTSQYWGSNPFEHNSSSGTYEVGFSGAGYNKEFKNNIFPYDILKNVGINSGQSKISQISAFGGLFSYTSGNVNDPENNGHIMFPESMFEGASSLEDISGLFINSTSPITLTSEGFKDCPILFNVTRLFYINQSNPFGNIDSKIPFHFFYLGEESHTKTYYIAIDDANYSSINVAEALRHLTPAKTSLDAASSQELENIGLRKVTVSYKTPKTHIMYAAECFYGQNSIKPYTWDRNNSNKYYNQNYIPAEHYVDTKTNQWVTRSNEMIYTAEYDISNQYDGDYNHIDQLNNHGNILNNYYCKDSDNVIVNETINPLKGGGDYHYITPPDLFNSFENDQNVSVRGMFKWCGSLGSGYSYNSRNQGSSYGTDTSFKGRICPYIFNPISNVQSLIEFFEFCQGLSTYQISGDPNNSLFILPPILFSKLGNLTDISKMMAGTFINNQISQWPFASLSGRNLKIRGLFSFCEYANVSSMSGLFTGLKLTNITGAFCCYITTLTQYDSYSIDQLQNSAGTGQGLNISWTPHQDSRRRTNVNFSGNFSGANVTSLSTTKFLYVGHTTSNVSESGMTILTDNTLSALRNIGPIT